MKPSRSYRGSIDATNLCKHDLRINFGVNSLYNIPIETEEQASDMEAKSSILIRIIQEQADRCL